MNASGRPQAVRLGTSHVRIGGRDVPVVSGGAHWGGGLFLPARDLALIGQLFLDAGRCDGSRLLSADWIEQSWTPCPVKREYGYLWWLNEDQIPWPGPPRRDEAPAAMVDGTYSGSTLPVTWSWLLIGPKIPSA